jgi:hypothetical protein
MYQILINAFFNTKIVEELGLLVEYYNDIKTLKSHVKTMISRANIRY